MTSRKTFEGPYFKALDDDLGTFEAVVSVFGNVDYQGDRVMPGAFEDHLKSLRAKGAKLPVVWSHDWGNPFAHIGYVDPQDALEITTEDAKAKGFGEILGGLYVRGHLDVHKEFAKQVYDLLKDGRVREWSFAYDVVDEARAKDGANELNLLKVWEVGPTLKGANNSTATLTVKGIKTQLDLAQSIDTAKAVLSDKFDLSEEVGMKFLADFAATQRELIDGKKADDEAEAEVEKTTEEIAETYKSETIYMLDEKAGFKPWHIAERDGKYCVIKDSDGTTEKCHDTRDEAVAHMRALYANEPPKSNTTNTATIPVTITTSDGTSGSSVTLEHPDVHKAGRRISKDSEQAIRDAIANLQSLLDESEEDTPKSDEAEENTEPDAHKAEGADEIAHYKAIIDSLKMDETS